MPGIIPLILAGVIGAAIILGGYVFSVWWASRDARERRCPACGAWVMDLKSHRRFWCGARQEVRR